MAKLVVDIGGTFIRLAISEDDKNFIRDPQKIKSEKFANLEDALLNFVQGEQKPTEHITHIRIAKSGRSNWIVDKKAIAKNFPNAEIMVVNDFEANALGLVTTTEDELLHLGGTHTTIDTTQPRAVIGSGTGLGLAYITSKGDVQKSHGGHMLPALVGREQIELFAELQKFKTDQTCPIYEDALAGNGIINIYKILNGRNHLDCEYRDTHHLLAEGRNNPLVQQALKYYHEILGQFAHQVVAFGAAYGGLFLTGGITDRLIGHNAFDTETFINGLYQKNVPIVRHEVMATPIFWVKDEFISLKGLLAQH